MRDSFVLYTRWGEVIQAMSDTQTAQLFRAILAYERDEKYEITDPTVQIAFIPIRQELDANNEKWEKTRNARSNAGKQGGRPSKANNNSEKQEKAKKTNALNAFSEKQTKAKKPVYVYVNDNVNDNVSVYVNDSVNNNTNVPKEENSNSDIESVSKSPKKTQTSMVAESDLSDPVKEKLMEWLSYKKERKESYKETGLRSLITETKKHEQQSGAIAVIDVINLSMSNGWRGIIWDRIAKNTQASGSAGNVFDAWDRA